MFFFALLVCIGLTSFPVIALQDDSILVALNGIEIQTDYSSSDYSILHEDVVVNLYNTNGLLVASWEIINDENQSNESVLLQSDEIQSSGSSETLLHKRYIGSSVLGFYVNYNVGYRNGGKYIISKNYDKVEWVNSIGIYTIVNTIKWANVASGLYPTSFNCHYNVTIRAEILVSLSAGIKAELKAIGFSFDANATSTVYSVKTFYEDFTLRINSIPSGPCYQQGGIWVCPASTPVQFE